MNAGTTLAAPVCDAVRPENDMGTPSRLNTTWKGVAQSQHRRLSSMGDAMLQSGERRHDIRNATDEDGRTRRWLAQASEPGFVRSTAERPRLEVPASSLTGVAIARP